MCLIVLSLSENLNLIVLLFVLFQSSETVVPIFKTLGLGSFHVNDILTGCMMVIFRQINRCNYNSYPDGSARPITILKGGHWRKKIKELFIYNIFFDYSDNNHN